MNKQSLYISPVPIEALEDRIAPATIIVTNLNDSGAGSLRDAVDQANMDPEVDTIKFAKTAQGTLILASQITITEGVNIVGPGVSKLSISGNNATRAFTIDDGSTDFIPVAISGLRFINGNSAEGGAIQSSENLTLNKTDFLFNTATGDGGAVASTAGSVVIQSSNFTNNSANRGGAISVITDGGTAQIIGSTISGNKAATAGGIYLYGDSTDGGAFTINKTTIANNVATNSGGGILSDTDVGSLTIIASKITGNSGSSGGGLYFDDGKLYVQKSTFSYNSATSRGGAMALSSIVSASISGSTISFNKASGNGGGLYLQSLSEAATISSSKILSNISGASGGGVFSEGHDLSITGSTLSGNSAANDGGGVRAEDGGSLLLSKTKVLNNTAGDGGAGVSTSGTAGNAVALDVVASLFQGNRSDSGAGIDTSGDGAISVEKSKFYKNSTSGSDGGAMYLRTNTTAEIVASIFSGNTAFDDAGALALGGSGTFAVANSKFQKNAAAHYGGGIGVFFGTAVIDTCTITGNSAGSKGGGVANFATTTIQNSKVTGNTATMDPDIYGA